MQRMMLLAGALVVAACEARTLPDADSTAASRSVTDTVAGTVTTIPGTSTVATAPGALPADSSSVATAAPGTAAPGATGAASATPAGEAMRLEVDVNARTLHVFRGGQESGTYPVAVGSAKWPTQRGEWTVKQVVINPAWIPPDESWAEEREPKEPGAADNPLGRAQLVYDPPRTIHGTNQPKSVGTATSHGSIRMTNETIVALAKQVLAASGASASGKDDAWVDRALANRREKQIVDLPRPVPIRVY